MLHLSLRFSVIIRNLISPSWWRRQISAVRGIPFDRAWAEIVDALADAKRLPSLKISPTERLSRAAALRVRLERCMAPLQRAWPHKGTERVKQDALEAVAQALEELDEMTSGPSRLADVWEYMRIGTERNQTEGANMFTLLNALGHAQEVLKDCWECPNERRAWREWSRLKAASEIYFSPGASLEGKSDIEQAVETMKDLLRAEFSEEELRETINDVDYQFAETNEER